MPSEVHDTNLLDDFSLEQFSKLGEKEHKNFEQQVKVMAEKRKKGDEIDASAIAKKKRIKKDEPLDGFGFVKWDNLRSLKIIRHVSYM